MSLSVAMPRHDRLGEFLLLLETTNGRDKFCRLIQFGAKYMKWKEESEKKRNEQRVQQWGNLSVSMSTVRKVLRLFRTLAVLRALHRSLPSSTSDLTLDLTFNLLAKVCLAAYFTFDHLMYAQRIGLYTPPSATATTLNQLTEGSWLGEIIFTLLEQLVKLHRINQEQGALVVLSGVSGAIRGVVSGVSAVGWEEKRNAVWRSIARNAVDLPIALHFLGYLTQYPHGYFGALGVVSSLLSLFEMWPAIMVAPMKSVQLIS